MRRARLLAASVAALLLAGSLSGCLSDGYTNRPSDGGQSAEELTAALEAVPGIIEADAYTVPWYNPGEGGLFSSRGMDLLLWVTIDPEMHIVDTTEFLRQLGRMAWSLNDGYSPDGSVTLIIRRGADTEHDWTPDIEAVFGTNSTVARHTSPSYELPDGVTELGLDDVLLTLPDDVYERAFGPWPAEPAGSDVALLAAGAPVLLDPPGVRQFRTFFRYGEPSCFEVTFIREVGREHRKYASPVTLTLVADGEELATQVAGPHAEQVDFCDALLHHEQELSVNVSAPEEPGFLPVERQGVTNDYGG